MSGQEWPHLRGLRDALNWWWLNLVAQPRSRHTARYVDTTDSPKRHMHRKHKHTWAHHHTHTQQHAVTHINTHCPISNVFIDQYKHSRLTQYVEYICTVWCSPLQYVDQGVECTQMVSTKSCGAIKVRAGWGGIPARGPSAPQACLSCAIGEVEHVRKGLIDGKLYLGKVKPEDTLTD